MTACAFCGCTETNACVGADNRPCGWSGKFPRDLPICTLCEPEVLALIQRYAVVRTPTRPGVIKTELEAAAEPTGQEARAALIDDPIVRMIEGRALSEVIRERVAQLEKFGHGLARDAAQPLDELPRKASEYLRDGLELIRGTVRGQDLDGARRKLVRATALGLAALDRLAMEETPAEAAE